jgi:hypothetical protein
MDDPYPGATPEEQEKRLCEVRALINSSPYIPSELKPELDRRASAFLEVVERRGGKFHGGQLGWSYWTIRNDHLKLVETLAGAAIAITTYAAVATAAPPVLAVTLLFAAVALADKLKKKSAQLDEESYHVLMTLKEIGPAASTRLSDVLNGIRDLRVEHVGWRPNSRRPEKIASGLARGRLARGARQSGDGRHLERQRDINPVVDRPPFATNNLLDKRLLNFDRVWAVVETGDSGHKDERCAF